MVAYHDCPAAGEAGGAVMKLKCQANVIKLKYHRVELELIMKTNSHVIKDGV